MFDSEITIVFGRVSGIVSFTSFIPYIFAIFRGKTTPNRTTWFIWTAVSTISTLSYVASGANHTIWFAISDTVAPLIVLILAIKYGEDGWTKLDKACLIMVGISVFFWWLSGSAVIGLCMNLVADAMGAIPTIIKAYRRPASEDHIAWLIVFLATVINLGAIENWHSISIVVYPVYMFINIGIITGLLWSGPYVKRKLTSGV